MNYYNAPMARFPTTGGLKGHPVSSLEEVRATGIDFDGSIFFFPDIANNRIYTKQINMDGTASLNMYERKEIPVTPTTGDYVTRAELAEIVQSFQNQFAALAQPVEKPASTPAPTPATTKKTEYNF